EPRADVEDLVARARALRGTQTREAESLLARALLGDPEHPDRDSWRVERGVLLWALGEGASAREQWRTVGAASPQRPAASFYTILEAMARGRMEEEASTLDALSGREGRFGQLARGARHAARREWGPARKALRDVVGWEAALLRGFVEQSDPAGDVTAALRELNSALEDGVPLGYAFAARARCRMRLGNPEGAEQDYTRAVRLAPAVPDWLGARAGVRAERGDLAGARADIEAALRLDPRCGNALGNRGILRASQGDMRGALEDLTAAIAADPADADALLNRGVLRRERGDLAGALEDLEAARRIRPRDPEILLALAEVHLGRDEPDPAERALTRALEVAPRDANLLHWRAVARGRSGRGAESEEDLAAALSVDPHFAPSLGQLALLRMSRADWRGAAELFERFLEVAPRGPDAERAREGLAECRARMESGGR
ncbi:MAG: tetratricopeptide repeat protein, partial [Planctomycetales bacterium]|nr:tetratricopeptide repeat protein [Planctomycetales bacterium]